MKKLALATILATLAFGAAAQESPWLVRARVVSIAPETSNSPIVGLGLENQIGVSRRTIPEVDFTYFFNPNFSAELILTYPQKHYVTLAGANIGTFKHLPPTLTAQYHFAPGAQFNPYVGLGVNYTRISGVDLLNGAADLSKNSLDFAAQIGLDIAIDKNWSLNFDVKKSISKRMFPCWRKSKHLESGSTFGRRWCRLPLLILLKQASANKKTG